MNNDGETHIISAQNNEQLSTSSTSEPSPSLSRSTSGEICSSQSTDDQLQSNTSSERSSTSTLSDLSPRHFDSSNSIQNASLFKQNYPHRSSTNPTPTPHSSSPFSPPISNVSSTPPQTSVMSQLPIPQFILHPIQSTFDLYHYLISLTQNLQEWLLQTIELQMGRFKALLRIIVYILIAFLTTIIVLSCFLLFTTLCLGLGLISYWIFYYLTIPVQVYSFPLYFDFSATPISPPTAFISLPSHLSPFSAAISTSNSDHFNIFNNMPFASNEYSHFQQSYNSPRHSPGSPWWQYTPNRLLATNGELIQEMLDTVFERYNTILYEDSQYSNSFPTRNDRNTNGEIHPKNKIQTGQPKMYTPPNTKRSDTQSLTESSIDNFGTLLTETVTSKTTEKKTIFSTTSPGYNPALTNSSHPQENIIGPTIKQQRLYEPTRHIKPIHPLLKCHTLITLIPSPSSFMNLLNELHQVTPSDQFIREQIRLCFQQHYELKTPLFNDLQSKIFDAYDSWIPTPMFVPPNYQDGEKISQFPPKSGWFSSTPGVQTLNKFPRIKLPALLDSSSKYDIVLDLFTPHYHSIPENYQNDLFSLNIGFYHTNIQQFQYIEYLKAMKLLRQQQIIQRIDEIELFFQYHLRSEMLEREYLQLQALLSTLHSPKYPRKNDFNGNTDTKPLYETNLHDTAEKLNNKSAQKSPQDFHPPFTLDPSIFIPLATSTQTFSPYSNFYQPLITPSKISPRTPFPSPNINSQFGAMSSFPQSPLANILTNHPIFRFASNLFYWWISWFNPLEYNPINSLFTTADCVGKMFIHFFHSIPRRFGLWETPITQSILLMQGYQDSNKLPTHNVQVTLQPLSTPHHAHAHHDDKNNNNNHFSAKNEFKNNNRLPLPDYQSLKFISSGKIHFVIQLGGLAHFMYHQYYAALVIGTMLFASFYAICILLSFVLPTSVCCFWLWSQKNSNDVDSTPRAYGYTSFTPFHTQTPPIKIPSTGGDIGKSTSFRRHYSPSSRHFIEQADPFSATYRQYHLNRHDRHNDNTGTSTYDSHDDHHSDTSHQTKRILDKRTSFQSVHQHYSDRPLHNTLSQTSFRQHDVDTDNDSSSEHDNHNRLATNAIPPQNTFQFALAAKQQQLQLQQPQQYQTNPGQKQHKTKVDKKSRKGKKQYSKAVMKTPACHPTSSQVDCSADSSNSLDLRFTIVNQNNTTPEEVIPPTQQPFSHSPTDPETQTQNMATNSFTSTTSFNAAVSNARINTDDNSNCISTHNSLQDSDLDSDS